jgi:large subunit ribosomal protein L21
MYAVIKAGGRQIKVREGDTVTVDRLHAEPGSSVELGQVLMLIDGEAVDIGNPFVNGASVSARVIEHGREAKIRIVKFKRRKHYLKRMGHRQDHTRLEITRIAKS